MRLTLTAAQACLVVLALISHSLASLETDELSLLQFPAKTEGTEQAVLGHFGPDSSARTKAPVDLRAIQKCFKPKVVVTAGLGRSGSTSLTLAAQIWLTLADKTFQPLGRMPWHGALKTIPALTERRHNQNTSTVVKIHDPVKWVTEVGDVFLMSHRQPSKQIASTLLSGGFHANLPMACFLLIEKQHVLNGKASECCGGVAYDMQMEDLRDDPKGTLKKIARSIGICEEGLTDQVVDYATNLFIAHQPSNRTSGIDFGAQTWHTDSELAANKDGVRKAMRADPTCTSYEERLGRYDPEALDYWKQFLVEGPRPPPNAKASKAAKRK